MYTYYNMTLKVIYVSVANNLDTPTNYFNMEFPHRSTFRVLIWVSITNNIQNNNTDIQ